MEYSLIPYYKSVNKRSEGRKRKGKGERGRLNDLQKFREEEAERERGRRAEEEEMWGEEGEEGGKRGRRIQSKMPSGRPAAHKRHHLSMGFFVLAHPQG